MRNFLNSPKKIILFILFIALCVLMAIGGATMALSMGGVVK